MNESALTPFVRKQLALLRTGIGGDAGLTVLLTSPSGDALCMMHTDDGAPPRPMWIPARPAMRAVNEP